MTAATDTGAPLEFFWAHFGTGPEALLCHECAVAAWEDGESPIKASAAQLADMRRIYNRPNECEGCGAR